MTSPQVQNITVAVRVRPFCKREAARLCVTIEGGSTVVMHAAPSKKRKFVYDQVFDSIDPSSRFHVSQSDVYNTIGQPVLASMGEGYNASVFAYGQTGSGKSYTMMGKEGEERGLIPRICEEMFDKLASVCHADAVSKVEVTYLEIYNEHVRDLLAAGPAKGSHASWSLPSLRVREHPRTGPYVEDITSFAVSSYIDVERIMILGNRARTVAATNMNEQSSRSHAIFSITVTQTSIDRDEMRAMDKISRIHLVDLAGSERGQTQLQERLKEGCAINKSLSALGKVITLLAEASGKTQKTHIPYRDSVLTWLLRESLGGNAKTAFICTISPAEGSYEETLSTLRYATLLKKVQNTAYVNEDPNEKLIRELKEEVATLRSQLDHQKMEGSTDVKTELKQLRDQLEESEKLVYQLNVTWEEKLRQTEDVQRKRVEQLHSLGVADFSKQNTDPTTPYLINLNEDPHMSECLLYFLVAGTTCVGSPSRDEASQPDIVLSGLCINEEHCIIHNVNGMVTICPVGQSDVYVNGHKIVQGTQLSHGTRVILGQSHVFRFNNPMEAAEMRAAGLRTARGTRGEAIDWEYAMQERTQLENSAILSPVEQKLQERHGQMQKRLREMEEELRKQKGDAEKQVQAQSEEFERMERQLAAERHEKEECLGIECLSPEKVLELNKIFNEKEATLTKEQGEVKKSLDWWSKQIQDKDRAIQSLIRSEWRERQQMEKIGSRLLTVIPLVSEANAISACLKKDVIFGVKVVSRTLDARILHEKHYPLKELDLGITVTNTHSRITSLWTLDKLEHRIYEMRELYQEAHQNSGRASSSSQENDPFCGVCDECSVGWAHLFLRSLAHGISTTLWIPIVNMNGKRAGEVHIELTPSTTFYKPESLINHSLSFVLRILEARGLPPSYANDVHCRYVWWKESEVVRTEAITSTNPKFGFERIHTIENVTEPFLHYLRNGAIQFEIWGRPVKEGFIRSNPSQLDFFFGIDIQELDSLGAFSPVMLKANDYFHGGGIFLLKYGVQKRIVMNIRAHGSTPERVAFLRIGRARSSMENETTDVEMIDLPNVDLLHQEEASWTFSADWVPSQHKASPVNRPSKHKERIFITVEAGIKFCAVPSTISFSRELCLRLFTPGERIRPLTATLRRTLCRKQVPADRLPRMGSHFTADMLAILDAQQTQEDPEEEEMQDMRSRSKEELFLPPVVSEDETTRDDAAIEAIKDKYTHDQRTWLFAEHKKAIELTNAFVEMERFRQDQICRQLLQKRRTAQEIESGHDTRRSGQRITEGWLEKRSGRVLRRWTRLYFVCKPPLLFYFRAKGGDDGNAAPGYQNMNPRGVIPLAGCRIELSTKIDSGVCFQILHSARRRPCCLRAKTSADRVSWVQALRRVSEERPAESRTAMCA